MKQVSQSVEGFEGGAPAPGKFCELESCQCFDIAFLVLEKTNPKGCDSEN